MGSTMKPLKHPVKYRQSLDLRRIFKLQRVAYYDDYKLTSCFNVMTLVFNFIHNATFVSRCLCSLAFAMPFYPLYSSLVNLWCDGRNCKSKASHFCSPKKSQTVILTYITAALLLIEYNNLGGFGEKKGPGP